MFLFTKYLIVAIMLFLLISHGIIQFGIFEVTQKNLRSETVDQIKKGIPQDQQVILGFGIKAYRDISSRIDWKEQNEFRLDGKMYDILKTEVSEDSVYLYCLIDREESDLYAILNELIEEESENSDKENRFNNYFSHFYSYSKNNDFQKILQSENQFFVCTVSSPLESDLSLSTPPPRA